jgi:hypothetical protein
LVFKQLAVEHAVADSVSEHASVHNHTRNCAVNLLCSANCQEMQHVVHDPGSVFDSKRKASLLPDAACPAHTACYAHPHDMQQTVMQELHRYAGTTENTNQQQAVET